MDRQLPLRERMMIWMHVLMCHLCFRYKRQLKWMRLVAENEIPYEPSPDDPPKLSSETKKLIKQRLHQELQNEIGPF
jgi:hypothetical protein